MTDTKLRFEFESFLEKCKEVHELVDWGEEGDNVMDMEIGLTFPLDGTVPRKFFFFFRFLRLFRV
jgi:hypothetical protein